jgi:hypothetical protein
LQRIVPPILAIALLALAACAGPTAATPSPPPGAPTLPAESPTGAGPAEQLPPSGAAATGEATGASSERAPSPGNATTSAPQDDVPVGLGVGQRPPSFTVNLPDGTQLTDGDLRGQGKPYILYFFATW